MTNKMVIHYGGTSATKAVSVTADDVLAAIKAAGELMAPTATRFHVSSDVYNAMLSIQGTLKGSEDLPGRLTIGATSITKNELLPAGTIIDVDELERQAAIAALMEE